MKNKINKEDLLTPQQIQDLITKVRAEFPEDYYKKAIKDYEKVYNELNKDEIEDMDKKCIKK